MKKICSAFVLLLISSATIAQKALNVISIKETERIERTLSADEMQGRRTFTPGIEKAANFIASEFEKTGLQKWNDGNTYLLVVFNGPHQNHFPKNHGQWCGA